MSPDAQRMSRVDTAWRRMDSAHNLMMIVGVWLLRPGLAHAALCERVRTRLLAYPRFGQKVVEDAFGASWVADEDFDLRRHVVRDKLRRRRGQDARAALQARVGELAATPLDPDRPLWQFHLIEDYDGGSAMIARVHHCIGDGLALISVMLSITDGGRLPPERAGADAAEPQALFDSLLKPLAGLALEAYGLYRGGLAGSLAWLARPQHRQEALDLARKGVQLAGDAAALALLPDDSPTRLKGVPDGVKRVAWGEPIPLDAVKAIGRALNASVNDVLLACVAGAIGDYLLAQGDDTSGCEIRAMVPVNLRPGDAAWKLGNHFGLVPLVLPIGIANPVERVYAVRARMAELKGSYQPLLAFALLAVAGLLVKPAQDALLHHFSRKATAVMTNVPGPAERLRLCGSTLDQAMFWVPQSGQIGIGVSILSYGGGVQFGLITDRALCPEPQQVIERFEPEFRKLLLLALMLPWGEAA